ncbi:MAG: 16S rRNA (guanine(966)-N(2))-methyltransferase RsmD [Acetobacteraceae bacterium]
MRIIGGTERGRRLAAPQGSATRPTADRVRQALFDSLLHAPWAGPRVVSGASVLDAFAGTGALGLEALSRGAMDAVFFETDAAARRVLSANIAACQMQDCTRIVAADARHPPPGRPCNLVFLDPPYDDRTLLARALSALSSAGWIAPAALLVIENAARNPLPALGGLIAERHYGAARIGFFRTP